jgi:hypothetical protein
MMNIDKITSMLRRLEPVNRPEAVQQYAQQHKDNYIIMSLALQEANRRKAVLAAQHLNAPPDAKVNDQAIQSMGAPMPEDVGIGQLPAGNMNFAEGGIVAFSDGGDVPRYQSGGLLDAARARAQAAQEKLYTYGLRQRQQDPAGFQAAQQELATAQAALRSAEQKYQAEMSASGVNRAAFGAPTAAGPMAAANQAAPIAPLASPDADFPSAARTRAAAPGAGPGAGPGTNRGQRPPSGGPGAAAPSAAQDPLIAQLLRDVSATPNNFEPSQSTMPTVDQIKALYASNEPKPEDATDYFKAQRKAITDIALRQNLEDRAEHDRQVKERGLLGEKQEARLKTREEKLGKQEKDLGPLAMIQAGFAIMGGQSRSALQNIGLGAQVGLKGYREGVDKLQASRERIEDGLERIETARRSEGILNDQQRNALRREGNNILLEGERAGVAALMDDFNYRRNRAVAQIKSSVDLLIKKGEIGSAERLGAAQIDAANLREAQQQTGANVRAAAQLSAQERIAAMESAAKRADAATRLAEVKAQLGIKNDADLREIYAKSLILQQRFPDVNEYLKIMKGTGSTAGTDYSKWGTPAKVGP